MKKHLLVILAFIMGLGVTTQASFWGGNLPQFLEGDNEINEQAEDDKGLEKDKIPPKPLAIPYKPFDEREYLNGRSWMNAFEVVVVINKSAVGSNAQSLRLYYNRELIVETKVSTGREKWEPRRKSFFHKGPRSGYWSVTPEGYYSPTFLSKDHFSKLWRTRMPYAVFFNEGIAMHQRPKGTDSVLGKRASGGCVRIGLEASELVYEMVSQSGLGEVPQFDVHGNPQYDSAGRLLTKRANRTLIIVEDNPN